MKRPPRVFADRIEILLTRDQVAVIDVLDVDLAQLNWSAVKRKRTWYAVRSDKHCVLYLHRVIAGRTGLAIDGLDVDHHDGDGLNCRRINLRSANDDQNAQNCRRHRDNVSGFKGVYWHKGAQKWQASVCSSGVRTYLGLFPDAASAAIAYRAAAVAAHGIFARTE